MRQPAYQPARQQAAHYRYATARPAYQPPPARLKRSQATVPLETVDGAAEHTLESESHMYPTSAALVHVSVMPDWEPIFDIT